MDENTTGRIVTFPEGESVDEGKQPTQPKMIHLGVGTVLKPNTTILEAGEVVLMTGKNAIVIITDGQ